MIGDGKKYLYLAATSLSVLLKKYQITKKMFIV